MGAEVINVRDAGVPWASGGAALVDGSVAVVVDRVVAQLRLGRADPMAMVVAVGAASIPVDVDVDAVAARLMAPGRTRGGVSSQLSGSAEGLGAPVSFVNAGLSKRQPNSVIGRSPASAATDAW